MRTSMLGLCACLLVATTFPAGAQENDSAEIIVTGMRRLNPDDDEKTPAKAAEAVPAPVQMLRRTADFAVQQVIVTGDATQKEDRRSEIFGMTRKAIEASAGLGVQVATGELVVEPLTLANYKDLKPEENDDDGGEMVKFLIKVPLSAGMDAKAALTRIEKFIKAIPTVGRAEMKAYSELTLSVVNPEQYRGQIIDLVAKDTGTTSERFGPGYGVEVLGLDRPVRWKQASATEVLLFLPVTATVRPRS
jgi:hypothetical protein